MNDSLIATKLHIPPAPPSFLVRRQLLQRLNEALVEEGQFRRRLTLIAAPAGYGKTTLAASWINERVQAGAWQLPSGGPQEGQGATVIWLTLEKGDEQPARFFRYLFTALRQADATLQRRLPWLESSAPLPPVQDMARELVNSLVASGRPLILALDDYHHVAGGAAERALDFVLRYQPSTLHLLLASRGVPGGLPLARLRARQELLTLDQRDLRFTPAESRQFLQARSGRQLAPEEIEILVQRAAGWVGGLQLSALALREVGGEDSPDLENVLEAGAQHHADYLAQEVLATLPAASQAFLLRTSIVDRLCASLCQALMAPEPALSLPELEVQGYFLTRLDVQGVWYRYHALFQSFLRGRLQRARPDVIAQLHRRAAEWHRQEGSAEEAVEHALATGDTAYALEVVEAYVPWLLKRGSLTTLIGWLEPITQEDLHARPTLGLDLAWAYLLQGFLARAERLVNELQPNLPSGHERNVLAIRLAIARRRGDIDAARAYARQATTSQASDQEEQASIIDLYRAELYLGQGEPARARRLITNALRAFRRDRQPYLETQALYYLSNVHIVQGQLYEAEALCLEALDMMERYRLPYRLGGFHNRLGLIHWEWGKLQEAADFLEEGTSIARESKQVPFFVRNALLLAGVWQDQGRGQQVDILLAEIRRQAAGAPQALAWLTFWEAWSAIEEGQPAAASQWLKARGLEADDDPDYYTVDGYLLLARLLRLEHREAQARSLLRRLHALTKDAGDRGANISVLLELAQLYLDQGQHGQARDLVEDALVIGSPGAYIQRFVQAARQLHQPLATIGRLSIVGSKTRFSTAYLAQLLAACGIAEAPARGSTASSGEARLTPREREIAQLLAQGLSNPQIAKQLHISAGTVRWHLKNVYKKLDVSNRVEATLRLRALEER